MSATLAEPTAVPADVSVWPRYPTLYEIDTWVWLSELKQKYGKNLDLSSLPSTEWDAIAAFGLDAVWLMGVWERSPAGVAIANQIDRSDAILSVLVSCSLDCALL